MTVEIVVQPDEVIGTVVLDANGQARMTGRAAMVLTDLVVLNRGTHRPVTPTQGAAYLAALPYALRGTHLWARIKAGSSPTVSFRESVDADD